MLSPPAVPSSPSVPSPSPRGFLSSSSSTAATAESLGVDLTSLAWCVVARSSHEGAGTQVRTMRRENPGAGGRSDRQHDRRLPIGRGAPSTAGSPRRDRCGPRSCARVRACPGIARRCDAPQAGVRVLRRRRAVGIATRRPCRRPGGLRASATRSAPRRPDGRRPREVVADLL